MKLKVGFFLCEAFGSRRGALLATRDALPWSGGGLFPQLPYHRPQRGWLTSRASAPQRLRRIVEEVPGSRTRRGERARVERGTAGPPLAAPSLGAAQACPCDAHRSPPDLRATRRTGRERWASSSASAATASRRRPTTASPRRCRPLTSRYECGVPLFADFIGTRRLRPTRSWMFCCSNLTETRPAGEGHSRAVAHVQEAR